MNYEDLLKKLNNNEHFSFSRWGDGEWACLLGHPGGNCDGHRYFGMLGLRLRFILEEHPRYYLGLQEKAIKSNLGPKIDEKFNQWQLAKLKWDDADIIHNASIAGKLDSFIEHIAKPNSMLIANEPIINWASKAGFKGRCITIPMFNCWCAYEYIKSHLIESFIPGTKYFYCASMMSNVLIDDMYNMFGESITQIDCGSVLDPYAGICSRKYHEGIIGK